MDVNVAPDAVPDTEVDVLKLDVEKVVTGSAETLFQLPSTTYQKWSELF